MKSEHWLALGIVAGTSLAAATALAALAETPVAMVEDVSGNPSGVAFLEYLKPGAVIKLAATDRLVLDYFHSCARETITGGTVTVGNDGSKVEGGAIASEKVVCDGGQLKLNVSQSSESGTVVFRAPPTPGQPETIDRTLYSLSPIFDLGGPATRLLVEEIDKPGRRIDLRISQKDLIKGRFYDFAQHGERLVPGAVYRATANRRSTVFKIDPSAGSGPAALPGRLVQL